MKPSLSSATITIVVRTGVLLSNNAENLIIISALKIMADKDYTLVTGKMGLIILDLDGRPVFEIYTQIFLLTLFCGCRRWCFLDIRKKKGARGLIYP